MANLEKVVEAVFFGVEKGGMAWDRMQHIVNYTGKKTIFFLGTSSAEQPIIEYSLCEEDEDGKEVEYASISRSDDSKKWAIKISPPTLKDTDTPSVFIQTNSISFDKTRIRNIILFIYAACRVNYDEIAECCDCIVETLASIS